MKLLNYSVLSSLPFSFPYFLFIWCNVSFYQRKNYLLYVCVLVTQLCLTLFDHMACSPPGSSVHGILQARILEWVAIPFSRESSQPKDQTWVSRMEGRFFTIWATMEDHAAATAAKSLQSCPTLCNPIDSSLPGFPSLGFSRQEHWSGLPFPSPMHESEKWNWSRSGMSDS